MSDDGLGLEALLSVPKLGCLALLEASDFEWRDTLFSGFLPVVSLLQDEPLQLCKDDTFSSSPTPLAVAH